MKIFRAFALLCACSLPTAVSAGPDAGSTELVCDHMDMWNVGAETHAICTGSIILTSTNQKISCDRLEITAEGIGDKATAVPVLERFKYLLATGNVRIVQGEREATCGRAEVLPREDKVVLTEDPIVMDHFASSVTRGSKITMLRGERRVLVENPRATLPSIKDLGVGREKTATPADGTAKPDSGK